MRQNISPFTTRVWDLAGALASVIFPAPCRICGELLENASRIPLCPNCLACLAPYAGPTCQRCGRPIVSAVMSEGCAEPLCNICRRGLYDFDFARSAGSYTPTVARAIVLLKYEELVPLGRWFARRLVEVARAHAEECAADVVVPVPLHPGRLRERGYNQAELIARPLARELRLPCRSYLLVRTRPRPDKLTLTLRERWRSVRGAYAIRQGRRVDNLRVLLVDDVLTTGATLDACSRALRRGGASYIAALTVARAAPRGEASPGEPLAREPDT
jgi:competence protein ComFC